MPSIDDLKYKLSSFGQRSLGFLPEQLRIPTLVGVPIAIILAIVWIPSLIKFASGPPQPGAIDPAVLQAALEKEDRDRLEAMSADALKHERLSRQTLIEMAKYEKNDAALVEAEAAMARLQEVMKSKGAK